MKIRGPSEIRIDRQFSPTDSPGERSFPKLSGRIIHTRASPSLDAIMSAQQSSKVLENGLKDIYDAEQRIESALEEMAGEVENDEVRQAFTQHREETQGQIERLEQVFEAVGVTPEADECKAISGLIEEHESFIGENPSQAEIDLFDVTAAQKVEHYEIATYGSLAKLANRLGMGEAGDLLHQTLEEEEKTLDILIELAENYDYEQLQTQS